jgi:hypothetical protein
MLLGVALVRTDVSYECGASIRVTKIGELGAALAVTSKKLLRIVLRFLVTANVAPSSPIRVTLMMAMIRSFETSVLTSATQRNIPEYGILHSHRRENFQSYVELTGWDL